MNKITSILFLYITFLPAFSYAAFPDNIMTGMAGALYTNQSAHATNTDEYDELKKTVTECVNKTKQKNKSAPENYITNRANELKKNALTRNINYSTHVNFSTNDKRPKNFTCNITAKVGDFLKDKPQVQKIAPTTFNDIPTETAKQKCYETIARMVASDDWYVKECLTNKIKKDYGIQDVDDYYKKMYSPFPSAKKSDNTKVASAQNIEPEHIDAPIYNDANQSTVANFASAPSMVSTDTNTQQQYKEQFEEPNNQAIDLCEKSGGDWEQNTCNCEKYGMEYNKQKLRCTHPEIPSEKRSAPQLKSDYIAPQKKEVKKIKKTYDATTLITVSVVDHYDSNKKIKGITVCYTNDGSCKTTERNGIITFTQHHHKNESITPQITVKGSDEYECNTPTPIDTTDKSVELPDELVELPDELYELQHKTKPTANQSTNQHQFIIKCKKIEKQKSKKEKNQTKQDQEVTITIVNYYNKSEKIQGVKICTDTDKKDCKKTNKNGTITIKSGEQISIDSDYECNPQIAKVTNNETIKCKQKCTDKDLKKVPNATKCYIKPDNQYEISSCKNGYTPTNNKSACIEFVEEDIDTSILSCDISGGTWTPQINQCICDKNKRLKQSKDQKTCECENSNETYNKKIDKCEDTNAEEICKTSGGDWNGKKCKCDENKGLTRNKDTGICECTNTTYKYNTKSKKCTKTAQDIAIDNEFDRQNRINNRLRDACEDSGGSYDQINQNIADSYICKCKKDQTLNTQSGLCECTESGYIYSATEEKCIKPKITMDEYKQIEKSITEINDKTIASINTQCSNTQPTPTVCNSKEKLIQQIKDLQTQLLNDLKKMGANPIKKNINSETK